MDKLDSFSESNPRIGSPSPACRRRFQIPEYLKKCAEDWLGMPSFLGGGNSTLMLSSRERDFTKHDTGTYNQRQETGTRSQ